MTKEIQKTLGIFRNRKTSVPSVRCEALCPLLTRRVRDPSETIDMRNYKLDFLIDLKGRFPKKHPFCVAI
jgi:hypothetical protein